MKNDTKYKIKVIIKYFFEPLLELIQEPPREPDFTRLYNSELQVMVLFWDNPGIRLNDMCKAMEKRNGWPKKITKKIIKKLLWKKYIKKQLFSREYIILIEKEEGQENQKPKPHIDTYIECCNNKILKKIRQFRRKLRIAFKDVHVDGGEN